MKKKLFKSALLTLLFSLLFSLNVFAAGFTQDDAGIHYLKDDGTYAVSSWVEVSGLWFLFDANGVCINPTGAPAPDDTDGCYQIVTSYTPFVTDDTALLDQCLTNGTVVNMEGQYFVTPQASTVMRNANRTAAQTSPAVISPEQTNTPADNGDNFNTYNNAEQQETTQQYVLNTSTHKIHLPSCRDVKKIAPQNYETSNQSIESLISQEYSRCGHCLR
ncbi:MAG: hypothetical protein J6C19_16120 [Lachnospiraceae bacterium]|nr:hypothetical protein [Lachnospiraceae bacterium]